MLFVAAKNTQLTVPDMKYNVLTNLTNVQPIWGSWNHLWPIWQFRAKIGRFFGPPGPKSGPNHEKMRALCSTIITWPRKITKTVLAFKNRHGLDITRLGLPSTMCEAIAHNVSPVAMFFWRLPYYVLNDLNDIYPGLDSAKWWPFV